MSRTTHRVAALTVVGVLAAAALTGCGGSSSGTSSGGPTTFRSGGPGGFQLDPGQQQKIQRCLKAAGLSASFPTGRPSGVPSGGPSGSPPSGAPSDFTGGGPSGGPGGIADPEVQAALKACGISLPSRPTVSATSSG